MATPGVIPAGLAGRLPIPVAQPWAKATGIRNHCNLNIAPSEVATSRGGVSRWGHGIPANRRVTDQAITTHGVAPDRQEASQRELDRSVVELKTVLRGQRD